MIFSSLTIYSVEFYYTLKFEFRGFSKYNYFKEAKKENPDKVPIVYYADQIGLEIDTSIVPLAPVSKKFTIFCQEDGPMIEYYSDRYGFNNFDFIWDQKEIFAVTIGDSFTHGACVDTKNTIANKINNNGSVLNLGIGGTGPLIQLATVKEYLNAINTKRIIWIYYEGNDLADLMIEQRDKILKKYLENEKFSQNLTLKQKLIDEKLTNIITYKEENIEKINIKSFWNFIKLYYMRYIYFDKNNNYDISVPKSFYQIITEIKKIAEEKKLKLYFVYLPEKNRF